MAGVATPAPKLGILAGGGLLPTRIAERCDAIGRPYFIIAFKGQTDPEAVAGRPHMWARLGAAGSVIDRLHEEAVQEICMIGPMRRPSLSELMPDARATAFFARVGLRALGDNALLSAVGKSLGAEGFSLVGAKTLLSDMMLASGPMTDVMPDDETLADIEHGRTILRSVGSLDIGQSVIIQQGLVIAVEAIEGTDAMIERSVGLLRSGAPGVLVKAPKPQQDRRLDLPTIGAGTAERVAAAGLAGIAAAAGATLVVDREAVAEQCRDKGLFVLGFDNQEGADLKLGDGPEQGTP